MNGVDNMSYDLELLDKYITQKTKPILRFYSWKPHALSLGRNQSLEDINIEECKKYNIDIIKRPTGGKAVLHQGEVTYSFVGGKIDGLPNNIFESYIEISQAIIKGLEKLTDNKCFSIGNEPVKDYKLNSFCFAKSIVTDINYSGKKMVGSAQLRRGDNFLQHGSILINQDFELLKKLFHIKIDTDSLINLSDIVSIGLNRKQITKNVLEGFKEHFSVDFTELI